MCKSCVPQNQRNLEELSYNKSASRALHYPLKLASGENGEFFTPLAVKRHEILDVKMKGKCA